MSQVIAQMKKVLSKTVLCLHKVLELMLAAHLVSASKVWVFLMEFVPRAQYVVNLNYQCETAKLSFN